MKMNGKLMEKNVTLWDARAYGPAEKNLHGVGAACSKFLKSRGLLFSKRRNLPVDD